MLLEQGDEEQENKGYSLCFQFHYHLYQWLRKDTLSTQSMLRGTDKKVSYNYHVLITSPAHPHVKLDKWTEGRNIQ